MKRLLPFAFLLLPVAYAQSQSIPLSDWIQGEPDTLMMPGAAVFRAKVLKGEVQQSDGSPLAGATVTLRKVADARNGVVAITVANGLFRFERVERGNYTLQVAFVGYKPLVKLLQVQQQTEQTGILTLQEQTAAIDEVVVVGQVPAVAQQGDTTQFNAAAFKTLPDASVQDLVQKMPGISLQGGLLQAQGEAVQRVLIDGKLLFGNDLHAALQNLPAELVAAVQVYDKKSDMAELSGLDDGERIRTINIVTKPEARVGRFGKAAAGYGTGNTYMAGAGLNLFDNDRRLTLTGLSNNINQKNLSQDPEVNGQRQTPVGIRKTTGAGINFANTWDSKIDLASSYSYHHTNRELLDVNHQTFYSYSSKNDEAYSLLQTAASGGEHRFNLRLDYELDANNLLRFRSRGSAYQQEFRETYHSRMISEGEVQNLSDQQSEGNKTRFFTDNLLVYSHRFAKEGRTLNAGVRGMYTTGAGEAGNSYYYFFLYSNNNQSFGRFSEISAGTGLSWETEVSFTEPLGQHSQLVLGYEIGNRTDDAGREIFYRNSPEDRDVLGIPLSKVYLNDYLVREASAGYSYTKEKLYVQVSGRYRQLQLNSDQQYPFSYNIDRSFNSFLPSVRLRYRFSGTQHLEINYDTRTIAPAFSRLQQEQDVSVFQKVVVGNKELQPSLQNWFRLRYRHMNPISKRNLYASLEASFIQDYIGIGTHSIGYYENSGDVVNLPGTQYIFPENMSGYRNIRAYTSYGLPVAAVRSHLSLNATLHHNRLPGKIEHLVNTKTYNGFGAGATISSNFSERLDFTLSTQSDYYRISNTFVALRSDNMFTQHTRLWCNWIFWNGYVYRTNLNHQYQSLYDKEALLWNMSLGKKLFANEQGEISLNVYDLLKQNIRYNRYLSAVSVVESETNVLQRYFMLSFTYNIRQFRSTNGQAL